VDYDRSRATASRLIAGFGNASTATIYRTTAGAYDPVTDVTTGSSEPPHEAPCVVVPRGSNDISTPRDDRSRNEFIKVLISAPDLDIAPLPGDRISVAGRPGRFGVTDVKELAPDGVPILWAILAERGAST
jgi:hypothetical protein